MYRNVAKVLANRLKIILPNIIYPIISDFVPKIYIIDNILIAYKTFYSLTNYFHGQNRFMVIKVDMSKAYDEVK